MNEANASIIIQADPINYFTMFVISCLLYHRDKVLIDDITMLEDLRWNEYILEDVLITFYIF